MLGSVALDCLLRVLRSCRLFPYHSTESHDPIASLLAEQPFENRVNNLTPDPDGSPVRVRVVVCLENNFAAHPGGDFLPKALGFLVKRIHEKEPYGVGGQLLEFLRRIRCRE